MIPPGLILKLAPWIGGAVVALGLVFVALGIQHDLNSIPGLKRQLAEARADYAGEKTAFDQSEAARRADQVNATAAMAASAAACDARVTEARRSATAIRTIVNAPPKLDARNCPVRAVLDAGGLRDALGAHR